MATAKQVKMRRGTTLDNDLFTGGEGEVTVDLTVGTVRVHDGLKLGGTALALADLANVPEDTEFEQRIMEAVQALLAAGGGGSGGTGGTGEEDMAIGDVKMSYAKLEDKYLLADGSAVKKTDYPELYAGIGDRYSLEGIYASSYSTGIGWANPFYDITIQPSGRIIVVTGASAGSSGFFTSYLSSGDNGQSWSVFTENQNSNNANRIVSNASSVVAMGGNTIRNSQDGGLTWTINSTFMTGSSNYLFVVNNRFYVGNTTSGQQWTSTDGITWTQFTFTNFLTVIPQTMFYANGTYYAAGATALLSTSTDGITWTSRTSNAGASNSILGFATNGTIVVGVGGAASASTIITSSDNGVTWTARTSPVTTIQRNAVTWHPSLNKFFAVGNTNTLITSVDGINWTTVATTGLPTASLNWTHIAANNDSMMIGGVSTMATSVDGTSWVQAAVQRTSTRIVVSPTNSWLWSVGLTTSGTPGSCLYRSKIGSVIDDVQHSVDTPATQAGFGFVASNGDIANPLAVGLTISQYQGTGSVGVFGANFSPEYVFHGLGRVFGVAFANGSFFMWGPNMLAKSTDGRNWTKTPFTGFTPNNIVWTGNYYLICTTTSGTFLKSTDLVTFEPVALGLTGLNPVGRRSNLQNLDIVKVGNNLIVPVTSNTKYAYSKDNGTTWLNSFFPSSVSEIIFAEGKWFAITGTVCYYSSDMINWQSTRLPQPFANHVFMGIAYGNGVFVAVGGTTITGTYQVSYAVSPDGIAWTSKTLGTANVSNNGTSVAFLNGQFVIVAGGSNNRSMYATKDGFYWTTKHEARSGACGILYALPGFGFVTTTSGATTSSSGADYLATCPADQFRLPVIPPASAYDGDYYLKAKA